MLDNSKNEFPNMEWSEKILPDEQMKIANIYGFFNLSVESLFRFSLGKLSSDDIEFSQDNLVRVFCRLSQSDISSDVKNWAFAVLACAADGSDAACRVRISQTSAGRKRRQSHHLMEQFRHRYEIGQAVENLKARKVRSPNKVAAKLFGCDREEVKRANKFYRFMRNCAALSAEAEVNNSRNC